ncbi:ribosome-associated translation inhibitor RaiA [Thalassospiraceae bacterium LMO-SO8]|nr:ribosome-associated translation inhibitor RaiA [Alphaproteobacteria bacterium LMO-S08]WND77399.1 ribosome-associated translation inhibitor RaiA [Thalassospiraceae bacterium LMO-SO8]
MNITIKGKNLDVGDALRTHAEGQITDAVTKYFDRAIEASVVLSKSGHTFHAEISVHPMGGVVVHGRGANDDPYAAFDQAAERIAKQLRRYHRRLTSHHENKAAQESFRAQHFVVQAEPEHEELPEEGQPTIIAELPTEIPTLSVSAAVMRMDLADVRVQMFRDSKSGRLNVVYRREDGNIGWIDPVDGRSADA